MRAIQRITDPNLIAMGLLIKHLAEGRMTNRQLAEATGFSYLTVGRYTAALHQVGAAHISRFEVDARGAHTIRVFKLGSDDDAVPPARTRAVRAREHRRKKMLQRPLVQYG